MVSNYFQFNWVLPKNPKGKTAESSGQKMASMSSRVASCHSRIKSIQKYFKYDFNGQKSTQNVKYSEEEIN